MRGTSPLSVSIRRAVSRAGALRPIALVLLVGMSACLALPCWGQNGFSPLTPERVWDLAWIDDPELSPDGRFVVFTLTGFPRGTDTPSVDLWLVAADGKGEPRQLTRNPGPDFDPSWSPDSRSIVYASSRPGGGTTDIYVLSLRGGEPEPIVRFPTDARHPRYRGSGETIVFEAETYVGIGADLEELAVRVGADERSRAAGVGTEARLARRGGRAVDVERVSHLFEVAATGGSPRDLTPTFGRSGPIATFEWDLSPDGRLAAFTGLTDAPPFRSRRTDVYLLAIDDAQLVNLSEDRPGSAFAPRFGTKGGLLYGTHQGADTLAEFTTLVHHDLERDRVVALNDPSQLSPEDWRITPAGDQVYVPAEENGARHVFRTGINGGKARRVVEGGAVDDLRFDAEGDLFFLTSSLTQPPALVRTDANGRHARYLADFNRAVLDDTRLGATQVMRFPGSSGQTVEAHVVFPPGFSPERRWPVLLLLHGGPHQAWLDTFYRRWNLMAFATPGYVVVAPNPRGSTGYGQAFAEAVVGDPLAPAAADVLAIADALGEVAWTDPERLALVGGSYGGYLANWLITRERRFATAVVHAGIFDLMVQTGSDFPWGRDRTYGALPWVDPARYRALSPSTFAAEIRTPVLMLHGEEDHRVPTVQSLMLHNVLTGRDVPSRLVLFPRDGHRIDRRSAALRWWSEIFAWLERHAPPGPG